jgi:hypothetical protein
LILTETGAPIGSFSACGDITGTKHDNFDTSEASEVNAPGCVHSSIVPKINLTTGIGSGPLNSVTYSDRAQVLNTGGTDPGTCNSGARETHNWSPVSF